MIPSGLARKNLLVTGLPGVGKTTLIKKLAEALKSLHPVGFYTEEIREEGTRKGFELISLDGRKEVLSHVEGRSPYRVGKYKVDVKGFEEFLDTLSFSNPSAHMIVIDEIGKMECYSDKFKTLLKEFLDSERCVIATIAFRGSGFIEEIKRRKDVKLFEITQSNRNALLSDVLREVKEDV